MGKSRAEEMSFWTVEEFKQFILEKGTIMTPSARQFLIDKGIEILKDGAVVTNSKKAEVEEKK